MLNQEDDPELDDECLNSNERLTRFSKSGEKIVGRVKEEDFPYVQGIQSYEEDIFVRERVPIRTERPSVKGPGKYGNHAPIGQAKNYGSSANSQEILVSMDNVRPKDTEYQYITPPSEEAFVSYFHVRRSKRIRKYPQWYKPGFGATIECKNDYFESIVYMIQNRYLNINVDTNDIMLLLAEWDAKDCMDTQ